MSELAKRECVPCSGGVPALRGEELEALLEKLGGGWRVIDGHHLEKHYRFRDFRDALAFANRVGELAEAQADAAEAQERVLLDGQEAGHAGELVGPQVEGTQDQRLAAGRDLSPRDRCQGYPPHRRGYL